MSKKLDLLVPEVKVAAIQTEQLCESQGVDIVIYCTLRTLEEQARLYRQSRSRATINSKMFKFQQRGLGFLAEVIESVGPCNGPHRTNAAPGESYHNYGLAFDAAPTHNGKIVWETQDDLSTLDVDEARLWQTYGQAAVDSGLNWSGNWTGFREYAHSQLGAGSNPLRLHAPETIRSMLQEHDLI